MKTTLALPDELMRAIKIRAAEQNRKLQDIMADLLWRGLAQETANPDAASRRVQLPLIRCAHPARTDEEITPGRAAEILLEQESGSV